VSRTRPPAAAARLSVDNQPPLGVSLSLGSGGYAGVTDLQATIAATGARTMFLDGDLVAAPGVRAWVSFASQADVRLAAGDGPKSVTLQVRDGAGNQAGAACSVVLDRVAPTNLRLSILEGALTGAQPIHVRASADGAAQVLLEGDVLHDTPTFQWIAVPADPLVLTVTAGDGPKAVLATFRDAAGNTAGPVTAATKLDTTDPACTPTIAAPTGQPAAKTGDLVTVGGAGEAGAAVSAARLAYVGTWETAQVLPAGTVLIDATGALSGAFPLSGPADGTSVVLEVLLSARGRTSPAASSRSTPCPWTTRPRPACPSPSAPTGTRRRRAFHATIAANGASRMFLDGDIQDAPGVRAWVFFATGADVTLSGTDGPKSLTLQVRDATGNVANDLRLRGAGPRAAHQTRASPSWSGR